jgi:PiT family inorganic phosphate transporter
MRSGPIVLCGFGLHVPAAAAKPPSHGSAMIPVNRRCRPIKGKGVLSNLDPASSLAFGLLIFSLLMVIMFEATNGFHDAANAVATVIYTQSLTPGKAVILSGLLNFLGVLIGGIAVAYALVELLPAEVLSPPGGGPAVAMLVSLFIAALSWNIGTWWFGLPNSSSHCLIGSLIGIAIGNAGARSRSLVEGVHWAEVWKVLEGLALSPVLGFILAGALYLLCRRTLTTGICTNRPKRGHRSGGCGASSF